MSITFAPDTDLALTIDELFDEDMACEAGHHSPGSLERAAWWVICPRCRFQMAWCTTCRRGWQDSVNRMASKPPPGPVMVSCPSCDQTYESSALIWQPIA